MLKDFEKEWLEINNDNFDKLVIPEETHRNAIIFNLYGDRFSTDLKKGVQFVYKNFPFKCNERWKQYFDMIIPDYDNNIFYFYIQINSSTDLNYKNNLVLKLTNLVSLIKESKKEKNNDSSFDFIFKNNFDIRELMEDFINNEDSFPKILIYDLADGIDDNKLKSILEEVKTNDINVDILKNQLYKDRIIESLSISKSTKENFNETNFVFDYYDSDMSQTENGSNRNFIKYLSNDGKTNNYIFSFSGLSLIESYNRYKEILLEKNIRYGLMQEGKQVNNAIRDTIVNNPEDFWILNNGLTIITKNIDINEFDKKVTLKNFNVVNGGQTLTNLVHSFKYRTEDDNFNKIFIPTKIIVIGNEETEEQLEDRISKIVTSANNQKAVKARDLVSNDKNMKDLKSKFKEYGIVLNIKRGDQDFLDQKDAKDIKAQLGNVIVPIVKNDEVGQEIIALIMQNPAKSLQVKNKIFEKENYSKIFKNDKINYDNIVYVHEFKRRVKELVKYFIDQKEIDFSKLAYSNLSQTENDPGQLENNLYSLFKHTETWFISMLYYVIYLNQNQSKNLTRLNSTTKEEYQKINSTSLYDSLFLIDNDKLIVSDYPSTEFKLAFIDLLEASILTINEIYSDSLKEKYRSLSAFSFTNNFYKDYVSKMMRSYSFLLIPFLKQML